MTIRNTRDAIISWFQSDLSGSVFTSYSAANKSRYAVVFIALTDKPRTRFTGGQWRDVYTVTVHSVGESEDQCLWVHERVVKLTGVTLTVSGRKLHSAEYITGQPPNLDNDGPTPLWFSVSQFDIISDPA